MAPANDVRSQIPFAHLTPLIPDRRFRLEHPGCGIDVRLLDLLAPIGRGQRSLVLAPPHSARTQLLSNIAQAILTNHEDSYVMLVMIDERPEEVTEIVRTIGTEGRCEVIASTFDEAPSQHVALAEMAMHKAMRMVESGRDVVMLLDSLTQLTRAYNTEVPHSGKIVSAGLDFAALHPPKRLFGTARRVEEGGSMTIVATVLTDTGSPLDDSIRDEFRGKSNADVVLCDDIAAMHVYPALDVHHTGTRREDNLLEPEELLTLRELRRRLAIQSRSEALDTLISEVSATPDNATYLRNLRA